MSTAESAKKNARLFGKEPGRFRTRRPTVAGARLGIATAVAALSVSLLVLPQASAQANASAAAAATTATPTNTLGGYVVSAKATVSASFAVPTFRCPKTAVASISTGIAAAAVGGNSVEAEIALTCAKPAPPVLVAQVVSYCSGHAKKTKLFPVLAGNKISVTVTAQGVATVVDANRSATATVTGCVTGMTKAVFGMFCPTDWTIPYPPPTGTPVCTSLPAFTKIAFSNVTLGGKAISKSKPAAYELQLGTHLIVPGAVGSTGMTFADTYK